MQNSHPILAPSIIVVIFDLQFSIFNWQSEFANRKFKWGPDVVIFDLQFSIFNWQSEFANRKFKSGPDVVIFDLQFSIFNWQSEFANRKFKWTGGYDFSESVVLLPRFFMHYAACLDRLSSLS